MLKLSREYLDHGLPVGRRPPGSDRRHRWRTAHAICAARRSPGIRPNREAAWRAGVACLPRSVGASPDIEDAFQATFFILSEQASRIRKSDSAAAWLYKVAQRTAFAARRKRMRRRRRRVAGRPAAGRGRIAHDSGSANDLRVDGGAARVARAVPGAACVAILGRSIAANDCRADRLDPGTGARPPGARTADAAFADDATRRIALAGGRCDNKHRCEGQCGENAGRGRGDGNELCGIENNRGGKRIVGRAGTCKTRS